MKFELKYPQVTFIFAHSKTPAKNLSKSYRGHVKSTENLIFYTKTIGL